MSFLLGSASRNADADGADDSTVLNLVLVRHAEAKMEGTVDKLTSRGEDQARRLAERLSGTAWNRVYVSTKNRALQTLCPLRRFVPEDRVVESRDLREIHRMLVGGPPSEHGDAAREVRDRERIERIWARLAGEQGKVLMVAHGNVIRYFLGKVLGIEGAALWHHLTLGHVSITTVERRGDRFVATGVNLVDHQSDFAANDRSADQAPMEEI